MKKKLSVLLAACSIFALAGCVVVPAESPDPTASVTNPEKTSTPVPTPDDSSDESYLGISDTGTLKDWSITVTDVEITDRIVNDDFGLSGLGFSPDDGNQYVKVDCTITNNGTSADTFLPSYGFKNDVSAKILYREEYEYSSSWLAGFSEDLHNATINPLSSKSGIIVFEMPDSVTSSDDELILVLSAGKDKINFKVR